MSSHAKTYIQCQLHKEVDTATHTRSSEREIKPGPIMLLILLMLNSLGLHQMGQPNFKDIRHAKASSIMLA